MPQRTITIELDNHHVHLIVRDGDGELIDEVEGEGETIAAVEASVVAIVLDTYREATR